MIKGSKHAELSAKSILEQVSSYDIYRYYYGRDFISGDAMMSPFRNENNPSFVITHSRNKSEWLHKDYSNDNFSGNCFQFVEQLFTINYNEALEKIDTDMQLGIRNKKGTYKKFVSTFQRDTLPTQKHTIIQVKARKWKEEELDYWKVYGVEQSDFKQVDFSIYVPEEIWLNKKRFNTKGRLTFCYLFQGKYWKIYSPYAPREEKWISNVPGNLMYGLGNIKDCEKAIITKSVKDLLALQKIYPCVGGCQSESSGAISEESIEYLKSYCKEVYIAFDSDVAGKRNSWYYTEKYGFKHLNPPDRLLAEGVKDFSGWIALEGQEEVRQHLIKKGIICI